ncbi:MAG: DUF1343 domain-containing protein [Lentisphaerota bacterium]
MDWLKGKRVGLIAHPASISSKGIHAGEMLRRVSGMELTCLFGPEHGFVGRGGAGEEIGDLTHPEWHIPIYSLYGETRRPTSRMLEEVDILVFDLQDLGARPYTYVSTLRHVLEAAAEHHKTVIIADRPLPLPNVIDGPMLEPSFESFVGFVRTPVVYGMTPGETACWMQKELGLDLALYVAPMKGYARNSEWPQFGLGWIPPSPAIKSIDCARGFPFAVFFEALPSVDHGRKTPMPFQLIGAPWLNAVELKSRLAHCDLPGMEFAPCSYTTPSGLYAGQSLHGLRVRVADPASARPVRAAIQVISLIQELHGAERLWRHEGVREEFFDKLMGTDSVRKALQAGTPPDEIAASWNPTHQSFLEARQAVLLYHSPSRA